MEDSPPFKDPDCTCPHGIGSGGRLYGIDMGPEWHRLDTEPNCPVHAPAQPATPSKPRKPRPNYYLNARASMEAVGIDPDTFDQSAGNPEGES